MDYHRIKRAFQNFWNTEDSIMSLIRDILIAIILVMILLTALWSYTGQWFGAPMVAIESGSMMHPNEEGFGRVGFIDAGDMVLLVNVEGKKDIITREKVEDLNDYYFYSDYGDVVIYRKYGNPQATQIIHRAICWIDYNETSQKYTVEEYNITNESSITISELGLKNYRPNHSGFITQGDNSITNPSSDQAGGICDEPIRPEWITGKARGELPWIGTINLLFNDITSGSFWNPAKEVTVNNVPSNSIICLVLLIVVLISIPMSFDLYDIYKYKHKYK